MICQLELKEQYQYKLRTLSSESSSLQEETFFMTFKQMLKTKEFLVLILNSSHPTKLALLFAVRVRRTRLLRVVSTRYSRKLLLRFVNYLTFFEGFYLGSILQNLTLSLHFEAIPTIIAGSIPGLEIVNKSDVHRYWSSTTTSVKWRYSLS